MIVVLMGAACSIANPLFELDDGAAEVTSGASEQVTTGGPGPGSEATSGSASQGRTSGPDTDTGEPTGTTGVVGVCGDGRVDPGETCDDGNVMGGDMCPATCVSSSCGDAQIDAMDGEDCDDGNQVDDDACTNACRLPVCGDAVVQAGEQCDDGNMDETDSCLATCVHASCGDGFVQAGEVCDDGVDNGGYMLCNTECSGKRVCGDGKTDPEESCDDGNDVLGDGCDNCVLASCGDMVVNPGEGCDDGNEVDDDNCTNACQPPACGDNILHPGEQCDDGNAVSTDACTSECQNAKCGDGYVWDEKEGCDDENLINEDACLNSCTPGTCGDGVLWPGVEECDDANNTNNDGCSAFCTKEINVDLCDNGVLDPAEECDPSASPFKDLGDGVCTDSCVLKSCFRVHNNKDQGLEEPVFIGNNWLTACAAVPGTKVAVVLVTDQKQVVYAAKGSFAADWVPDNLTRGQAATGKEYEVSLHTQLVPVTRLVPNDGKVEQLMLTSQLAKQDMPYDCHTSIGDGYGVGIFPDKASGMTPRVLVMGARGGQTNNPRAIKGFKASTEISFNGAAKTMPVCGDGVVGFTGTFHLVVF